MEKEFEAPLIILFCLYLIIVPTILYFVCPACLAYEFSGKYISILFFLMLIFFGLIPYLFTYFTRKWNPNGSIAVRSGDKVADWGDGWVWIPPFAGKALYYDHKPQRFEKQLFLISRDGIFCELQAHIVWRVNREALDRYFENPNVGKDVEIQSIAALQRWARERGIMDILIEQPDNLPMPLGTELVSVTLLDVRRTEAAMKMTAARKKDYSEQCHGIIDKVETLQEVERLRKTLREQLPELSTDIDQFCYQKAAKIKTGRK